MGQRNFQPKHRRPVKAFNGRAHIDAMYDKNWERYRARFLAINTECYACGVRAEAVDHLKPHLGDEFLFKKTNNHIPLCISCHNTITSLFDRKYRAGGSIDEKIKWLSRKRIPGGEWNPKKVKVLPNYE